MEITRSHILPILAMFVAIIGTAISVSVYNQEGDNSQVTANQGNTQLNFDAIKALEKLYETHQTEHQDTEIGAHNHAEYALKKHGHIEYATQVHNHGTTTTGGSSDFDLYTSIDSRGDNTENRFSEGERVYIHGYNDSNERNIEWEIRDPDNVKIYSRNTGTSAFDDFFLQYQIPDNSERGTYTVIIEIDRDEDEITFFVE